MKKYVIYYRVSTKSQAKSGLGLEAQERDIKLFLESYSDIPYEVIGTYTEVQSGKHSDRPELALALDLARKEGAELLVSKLDRLSRRVSFIGSLTDDKKLKIRVASMPHADAFQLHIYAALAQQEREFISARTKAALAEAKARGAKLGGLRDTTNRRNIATKRAADAAAYRVSSIILPMREGGSTMQQIADALNSAKVLTPRGRQWHPKSVSNALKRLEGMAID